MTDKAVLPGDSEVQLLAAIVESSEDAIIGKDLNGVVYSWNRAAERLYGYTFEEMLGRTVEVLLPDERRDEDALLLHALHAGAHIDHFEATRRRKNGETIHVSLTISPIRAADGAIVGTSDIARNITNRVELERDRARLAAIVESSQDAIVGKSLTGIVETWNRAAAALYGYSAAEMIGQPMRILLPPDRSAEEADILDRVGKGERVEHYQTVRQRKDGTPVTVSLTISPVRGSRGEVVGASHIARDITTQKDFEARMQHMQKMESLGLLAGGVAHDFNNLLTGILGNASLAAARLAQGGAARAHLADVIKAAESAALLTRQLLAYAGGNTAIVDKVDLSELTRETSHLIRAAISSKVQVLFEVETGLPVIRGDVGQLQQVIMNLVLNAAEAIGDETGTVIVRTWLQYADELYIRTVFTDVGIAAGNYVVLEVHDTGCGMDEQTQARIFDPFFTTKVAGRGLGLAAVLGIVRSHGGALKVYSAVGQGTTFKLLFPVLAEDFQAIPQGEREVAPLKGRGHILVVDDNDLIGRFAQHTLEFYGYSVTVARSGSEGISLFERMPETFRLILLDLAMPGMSGEDVFRRLQAIRPNVPVLLTSGFSKSTAIRHFSGKGLAGFIQKPYSATQLAEQVKAAIESGGDSQV